MDKLVFAGVSSTVDFAKAMVLASLKDDEEKYNLLDEVKLKLSKNEHFKTLFRLFIEQESKKEKQRTFTPSQPKHFKMLSEI
ncbi:MAG: hypothetical protein QXD45_06215 [Candidatus Bathyarchaeia archaeon]